MLGWTFGGNTGKCLLQQASIVPDSMYYTIKAGVSMCWRRLVQYLLVCARLGQEGEQIHRYSHTHMHTNNTKKRDNRKVLKLANLAVH